MAKVNEYVQGELASSLGIMPGLESNAGQPWQGLAQNADEVARGFANVYVEKRRQQQEAEKKLNDINNTLTAYQKTINAESEMYKIIDNAKAQFSDEPYKAYDDISLRGNDLIQQIMNEEDNVDVKEKMAGILTNSLRGKLGEVHSWAVAQDTANAGNKIQTAIDGMCSIVRNSNDLKNVKSFMDFIDNPNAMNYRAHKQEGVRTYKTLDEVAEEVDRIEADKGKDPNAYNTNFGKYMDVVYGGKSKTEKDKAKRKVSSAYVLGMIDRGDVNQAKAVLNAGSLDAYITPEDKHKYLNMCEAKINAQKKQQRMDNMYQIFDIKQNAVIKAANGQYSVSDAVSDNQKIEALGGTPTTMLTNAGVRGQKTLTANQYKAKRKAALESVNNAFQGLLKNGKVDPEANLRDILKFQNLLMANKGYLTNQEYQRYNKMAQPLVKHIKGMKKNIFGMPQGDISGKDPTHRGYLLIYNFGHSAYAGKANQQNAITNMLLDFSQSTEALRNRLGRELTASETANLANRAIYNQRLRNNKYLRNVPKTGAVMRDKYGNMVKVYPNGKHQIIKYGR